MVKHLKDRLKVIRELQMKIKEVMKCAPDGSLRCIVNKGTFQYYIGSKYQSKKNRDLVKRIAQKEYCQQLSKYIEQERKALEKLLETIENCPLENVYNRLHPARKELVEPLVKPVEKLIEEFENIMYEGKAFSEEDATAYYTNKGERVRSKSEKIIADTFERKGISYHYEMPLKLKYRNKTITLYPDFTVMNIRTGKVYIFEHFGMMDKPSYFENAMLKMDTYEKNNIMLGDKLIITHETSGGTLDTNVLENYIDMYLV